jgi:regulator of sigma E protease
MLHEAGHFFAAKATGMRVERFFLFFGPTIWSFKRGETEYGVKAIPLGGYVKISGMNPEEELPPEVAPRAYYRQPVWKRIVVIGAGPGVNIALALVILFFVFFTNATASDQTVGEVLPKEPATGVLRPGDKVVAVDGRTFPGRSVKDRVEDFRQEIGTHRCAGKQVDGCAAATPVAIRIERDGAQRTVHVRPKYNAEAGQTLVGFKFGTRPTSISPGEAVDRSTGFAWQVTHETLSRFAKIFNSKERKEIHGIVGVSDGGHIFWSLVEKLRGGRQVSLATMEKASVIGIVLVVMLAAIGLSNDIGQLTGEGFNVR